MSIYLEKVFIHRSQASETCTNSETGKAHFCNWGVDDALLAKLVQQSFCHLREYNQLHTNIRVTVFLTDLVSAIIAGDFLTHNEDLFVAKHFLLHSRVECLTNRHLKKRYITYGSARVSVTRHGRCCFPLPWQMNGTRCSVGPRMRQRASLPRQVRVGRMSSRP